MFNLPMPGDLKELRKKAGLTQLELAKKAGVSQSLIARIEKNNIDPRLSTLRKILDGLKTAQREEKISVGQIMKSPLISVGSKKTVGQASILMERHGISQLPVIENGVQIGSITETKVVKAMTFEDPSKISIKKVEDVMSDGFPTVTAGTDIRMISQLMDAKGAVLVVEKGKVAGIVTKSDLLKLMGK